MFVGFIYTECQSPGPFKEEPGFKFKSVVDFNLNGRKADKQEIETTLNSVTAAFMPYKAPTIDVFMKPDDFKNLEKQWSYQGISSGKYAFVRQFTSGVSNGRPDNPFHQGFVIDASELGLLIQESTEISEVSFPRPVDFHSWNDWLTPRGDVELEDAKLESNNPPFPERNDASRFRAIETLVEAKPEASGRILSDFEASLTSGLNLAIAADSADEFLTWVSFLTHLIPMGSAWKFPFTSSPHGAKLETSDGTIAIYRGPQTDRGRTTSPWVELAKTVVDYGLQAEIEALIGEISRTLAFPGKEASENLVALPLAFCMMPKSVLEEDILREVAANAAELLEVSQFNAHWTSEAAAQQVFEKLETPTNIFSSLVNLERLSARLGNLPVGVQ